MFVHILGKNVRMEMNRTNNHHIAQNEQKKFKLNSRFQQNGQCQ